MKQKNNKSRHLYNEWSPRHWSGSRYELTLNRLMSKSLKRQFGFFMAITLVIFLTMWLIGLAINYIYCRAEGETNWNVYTTFVQLTNPNSLEDGHFIDWIYGIAVTLFGLFAVNGIVVTVLVNWLSNRRSEYENGQARYNIFKKSEFAVIIGGHPVVASLIKEMKERREYDYILIQTKRDPEELRRELLSVLNDADDLESVIIYFGERTSKENLMELNLELAKEIFIIGESRDIDGTSHDAINLKSLNIVGEIVGQKAHDVTPLEVKTTTGGNDAQSPDPKTKVYRPIPCNVMFDHQSTFTAFQFTDVELKDKGKLKFMPFNIYEIWAQQVIVSENDRYKPLDGKEGIRFDSPERVHLIIVGMSREGVSMAVEAAHACHFPNFLNKKLGHPRTLITFIDINADREMNYFKGRFNALFELSRSRYAEAGAGNLVYDCPPHIDPVKDGQKRAPEAWVEPWKTDPSSPFNAKYPYGMLGDNFVDVDWEFIKGDIADSAVKRYLTAAATDSNYKTSIAICIPDDAAAASAALYMPEAVYADCLQVLVHQNSTGALINDLASGVTIKDNDKFRRYARLKPFGMLKECSILKHLDQTMPAMINYVYTYKDDKYKDFSNICDTIETADGNKIPSQKAVDTFVDVMLLWQNLGNKNGKSRIASIWSSLYSANSIPVKLRSIGIRHTKDDKKAKDDKKPKAIRQLTDEEIKLLALTEHNRWNVEELLIGYRPVLPCELPAESADTKAFKQAVSAKKSELKSHHVHINLLSNERLRDMTCNIDLWNNEWVPDEDSSKPWDYDIFIIKNIPNIIKAADNIENKTLLWPDDLSRYIDATQ